MANTYTSLIYHLVFSTKNRYPWIHAEIEARVWRYIGGIARKHKMTALQIGGIEDHLHSLVMAPSALAPSQIAQFLKGDLKMDS
ncbi:MAG TPA: transposase [Pyrinomonadaceae bacterium]|nr:transposase [Pyrinomonadaceae bacterium]